MQVGREITQHTVTTLVERLSGRKSSIDNVLKHSPSIEIIVGRLGSLMVMIGLDANDAKQEKRKRNPNLRCPRGAV